VSIQRFEQRFESFVEGLFTRLFRSQVKPVELGRRIIREMDMGITLGISGQTLAPNQYTISLSPDDYSKLETVRESLIRELSEALRKHAVEESYSFLGTLFIHIESKSEYRNGLFQILSDFTENKNGLPPGALLTNDGERVLLKEFNVILGRAEEAFIQIDDPEASRNHAKIRLMGPNFVISDLSSTNGTIVNGNRISEHVLRDYDTITIGNTSLRFEAS
jgi:hypothetical protein